MNRKILAIMFTLKRKLAAIRLLGKVDYILRRYRGSLFLILWQYIPQYTVGVTDGIRACTIRMVLLLTNHSAPTTTQNLIHSSLSHEIVQKSFLNCHLILNFSDCFLVSNYTFWLWNNKRYRHLVFNEAFEI